MLPIPARLRWSSSASPTGRVGLLAQPAQGLVLVPVGTEEVGPEVADDLVLVGGRDQLDDAQAEADGRDGARLEDHARLVAGRRHFSPWR